MNLKRYTHEEIGMPFAPLHSKAKEVEPMTSLLSSETGPYAVLDRVRRRAGVRYGPDGTPTGENELARALICPWCLSVWIGLVFGAVYYLFPAIAFWLALPLALSAGVIVLDSVIGYGHHR